MTVEETATMINSFKEDYKTKFEEAQTAEELNELREQLFTEELPKFIQENELGKSEESKLRIALAQIFNLRFHELNDDETFTGESRGAIDPRKILKPPKEVADEPKKIIQPEKKVIMI